MATKVTGNNNQPITNVLLSKHTDAKLCAAWKKAQRFAYDKGKHSQLSSFADWWHQFSIQSVSAISNTAKLELEYCITTKVLTWGRIDYFVIFISNFQFKSAL